MAEHSSPSGGRLIYHFAPEAFGSLRRLLQERYGAVVVSSVIDPLGDSATLELRVHGALLTLDFDHWDPFTSLSAGPRDRGVLSSLRTALDAGKFPVLEELDF